jgi:mannosyl-3-phosphoglycerate phosphatase
VLSSRGNRAQLEPLRRKLQHAHPFLTESGGGLFIPDGYFNLRLEGATRAGRLFCVPFARPQADAAAAVQEIAAEAGASVVAFSQMSSREISRNCGVSTREAELSRQREFSEMFFFAGETVKALALLRLPGKRMKPFPTHSGNCGQQHCGTASLRPGT